MKKNLLTGIIRFKTFKLKLLLLVVPVIFTGCVDKNPAIFVEVNGQILSTDEVIRQFKNSPSNTELVDIQASNIIDFVEKNLLSNLLFRADGYRLKLDKTPELKAAIDLHKQDILIGKNGILFQSIIPKRISVSEAEIRQLYSQCNISVKIAEIIVNAASLADSLYHLLQNGANFTELAKKHSIVLPEINKAMEDDQYITCGIKSPVFEKNVFRLNVGEISEPIELSGRFHIVKLLDRKQIAQKPYVETRDTLLSRLQKIKRDLFLEDYINSLFTKYEVDINKSLLPQVLAYFSLPTPKTNSSSKPSAMPSDNQKLAVYHGGELSVAEFIEYYKSLPADKSYPLRRTEDVIVMIRALLKTNLLYLDAIERRLDQDEKFFEVMRSITDRYVEEAYRRRFVDAKDSVSQSEIEGYFGENYEIYKQMDKAVAFQKIQEQLISKKRQKRVKKLIRKLKEQFIVRYNSRALNEAIEQLKREIKP